MLADPLIMDLWQDYYRVFVFFSGRRKGKTTMKTKQEMLAEIDELIKKYQNIVKDCERQWHEAMAIAADATDDKWDATYKIAELKSYKEQLSEMEVE